MKTVNENATKDMLKEALRTDKNFPYNVMLIKILPSAGPCWSEIIRVPTFI